MVADTPEKYASNNSGADHAPQPTIRSSEGLYSHSLVAGAFCVPFFMELSWANYKYGQRTFGRGCEKLKYLHHGESGSADVEYHQDVGEVLLNRTMQRIIQSSVQLLSISVGRPREVSWEGKVIRTGIFKEPVQGTIRVRG
jgi:hypothetical protein